MARRAARTRRRVPGTGWCARALLFAALLLGIVTMHTLGHPSAPEAPKEPAHAAMAAPGAGQDEAQDAGPAMVSAHDATRGGAHGGHDMNTDPMSLCLAVLGIWSAAALLGAAVVLSLRADTRDLLAPRCTRILRALLPLPPPRTALRLAQLSILRT